MENEREKSCLSSKVESSMRFSIENLFWEIKENTLELGNLGTRIIWILDEKKRSAYAYN